MRSELPSFPLDPSQPLDRSEVETTQHVPALRAEANGTMEIAAGDVLDVLDVADVSPKRDANGTMEITPGDVLEVTAAAGALAAAPPSARVPVAPITAPLPLSAPTPTPLPMPAALPAPTPLPMRAALAMPIPSPIGVTPAPAPAPTPSPAGMTGVLPAWPFTAQPAPSSRAALPSHASESPPVDDAASTWTLQVQAWRRPGPWTGRRLRGALITAGVLGFAVLVSVAALVVHLARVTHAADPADDPTAAATLVGRDAAARLAEAAATREGEGAMSVSTGAAAEATAPDPSSPDALPIAGRGTKASSAHHAAAPAAPASGGQGWLRTNGAEHGELVFVDGVLAGKSPAPIHVACGAHNVSVGSGARHRVVVPCGGTVAVR